MRYWHWVLPFFEILGIITSGNKEVVFFACLKVVCGGHLTSRFQVETQWIWVPVFFKSVGHVGVICPWFVTICCIYLENDFILQQSFPCSCAITIQFYFIICLFMPICYGISRKHVVNWGTGKNLTVSTVFSNHDNQFYHQNAINID